MTTQPIFPDLECLDCPHESRFIPLTEAEDNAWDEALIALYTLPNRERVWI